MKIVEKEILHWYTKKLRMKILELRKHYSSIVNRQSSIRYSSYNRVSQIILSIFLMTGTALSQDIHFTQFYASPLSLNPAQTGFFNTSYDFRVTANYRSQWASIGNPYLTYSAGGEGQFNLKNDDWIGAGLYVLKDKAGAGDLSATKINLSGSYHKVLDKEQNNILSFGLQSGYIIRTLDFDKLVFGNQLDDDGPNGQPNGEPVTGSSMSYFDINTGISIFSRLDDWLALNGGITIYHINSPKETFLGGDNRIKQRPLFHAGAIWSINDLFDLTPNLFYSSLEGAKEFHISIIGNYKLQSSSKLKSGMQPILFGGIQFRANNFDALAPVVGIEIKDIRVGISYDVNVSDLSPATNGKGGLEISLIYLGRLYSISHDVIIPCFRF